MLKACLHTQCIGVWFPDPFFMSQNLTGAHFPAHKIQIAADRRKNFGLRLGLTVAFGVIW